MPFYRAYDYYLSCGPLLRVSRIIWETLRLFFAPSHSSDTKTLESPSDDTSRDFCQPACVQAIPFAIDRESKFFDGSTGNGPASRSKTVELAMILVRCVARNRRSLLASAAAFAVQPGCSRA